MDPRYTEQQEMVRKSVRDFAVNEIAPGAEERDRTGQFDYDLFKRLAALGVIGLRYPEEYGGSNADLLTWLLAIEEVGRVDLSLAWTLMVGSGAGSGMARNGSAEDKKFWMDRLIMPGIRGEAIGAAGITEPGAGSNTRALQTTAVRDGGDWVINGTKAFITNAGLDICVVVSVMSLTDRERPKFNSIMVPTGTRGYTISPPYRKMGLRSSYTGELYFDNVRVPVSFGRGDPDAGRTHALEGMAGGRLNLASTVIGLHQACLDESLKYARERQSFGRPISKFQHIQRMIVDMATELELSRLLRDKVAWKMEHGERAMKEASMLKYFACESGNRAAYNAVQIHGGTGFMDECAVSRYYRDVRAATIADGTSQIQQYIIARELGC